MPSSWLRRLKPTPERLFDFRLDEADTAEDLDQAQTALEAIRARAQHRLAITPFSFRKAAQNPAQYELIIPFGAAGYVALFEIVSVSKVVVLAVLHQHEADITEGDQCSRSLTSITDIDH